MIKSIKDFYFVIVTLYSGAALTIFSSNEGLVILWLIGLIIFHKETYYTSKQLLVAFAVWMGYFVVNTFLIKSFHPFFMATYIMKIMIAYWLLSYYREKIFHKYEDVLYVLTVIALIFYSVQLVAPDLVYQFIKSIDLSQDLFPRRTYASIGIYTYHKVGAYETFIRNAGFTWEPGPFSSYIAIAIFINIARNNMTLSDKKRLLIYLVALITTQSTTGFVVLLAIILWYVWERNKSSSFVVIAVPLSIAIVIYLFISVPWLQEKIYEESEQDIGEILYMAKKSGENYAPGRFASLLLRWDDFKNYPIAGFGGASKLQTGYLGEDNIVAAISGVGSIMGMYGTIGSFLFLYLIFMTGKWLTKLFKLSTSLIFPIIILMIGFSFNIIESPLLATLWMTPIFLYFDDIGNVQFKY